jgi:hypothetical protein
MAHSKLVPDVRVIDCQVSDHEIGDEEFLEHVGANIACSSLLIRAKSGKPGCIKRRLDVLGVHAVEVDELTVRPWLSPEGHRYEGMGFSAHSSGSFSSVWSCASSETSRC